MKTPASISFIACVVFVCALSSNSVIAFQPGNIVVPQGTATLPEGAVLNAVQVMATPDQPPGGTPTPPPDASANQSAKPNDASKPEEKKGDIVKRKNEPPAPPNKKEFDVRPDEDGMVQFQFRNQAWSDLLNWVAECSSMSLDWQELPTDYLNIATRRKHTLEEARDLFNRHLLARGFTMLEFEGMIQVCKTAGINVAQVPKVEPNQLHNLPPHRFVRVSFPLTSLIATDVVKELEPLISTNGKLTALAATNRLEAMDTASNLREVYRILNEEQSQGAREDLAREFVLNFVRAAEAKDQLRQFLGIESRNPNQPMSPEEQMALQQQQMMMQQQQQQGGQPPPGMKKKAEIYIIANGRRNSVIVHAPPDKMAIIEAFVKRIDVPNENAEGSFGMESRLRVHRLTSLDPKQLVASLLAMDALEPTTRLEVDEKNKAIIAYASVEDHYTIMQTIKRLDGSARDVDVIQLRRLRAEEVAGTIKFLMIPEKKEEDNSSRRFFYYDPFGNNNKKETNNDGFRVAANSQDNQILIWANEQERAEVRRLLTKLGEIQPEGGNASRVRVIDANRSADTKEYLKRLQETWGKISPTPLVLPTEDQYDPPDAKRSPTKDNSGEPETATPNNEVNSRKPAKPSEKDVSQTKYSDEVLARLGVPKGHLSAATQSDPEVQPETEEPPEQETALNGAVTSRAPAALEKNLIPANGGLDRSAGGVAIPKTGTGAPIQITFDERGNLILMSDDIEALNRLEQMMVDNAPPQRSYDVFEVKHARASWIRWNLEDYYKEEKKKDSSDDSFRWIFGFDAPDTKKSEDPQLSKKRKIKFLSDNDTNSLIVIGADDKELKTIEGLIRLWDVPEKTNKQKLRYSKLVHVEYSRATVIVEAIKDAYRDLLSTNDKAFENKGGGAGGGEGGGKETKREQSSDSIFDGGMNFSFTGRLSLGVDNITNSIIVSAEGEDLLKLVCDMIKDLDDAAKPNGSIEIIKLDGSNAQAMERALKALAKAAKPEQANPNAENNGAQPNIQPPNQLGAPQVETIQPNQRGNRNKQ